MKTNRTITRWLNNNHRIIPKLTLLALFAFNTQLPIARAGDTTLPGGANNTQIIPWDQIGAKAGADYQGDGLAVTPIAGGMRLDCIFQRLDGEATTSGLWLTSTVTNQTNDRFQVRAAAVGRAGAGSPLADTGTVSVDKQTVRFERAGLVEEYGVSLDGVRQDFVVTGKPAGVGELEVRLAVAGAHVEAMTYGAQLVLVHSGRKIAYSRLRVTDATGKGLPARIEVPSGEPGTALAVVVNDAGAVYPIRIDPTFSDANWVSMGGVPGTDGTVAAAATDSAGNLYIGGGFTIAGNIVATNIARWNGSSWSALSSGMNNIYGDATVNALAASGTNLYAGGFFTSAGGVSATNIAQWNGSSWSALGSGMTNIYGNARVYALAVSGTNLYAGGYFTGAGGVSATNIAQWNGSSWSALGSGISGAGVSGYGPYVYALAVSGNTLYAGGMFTMAGGSAASYIAQWNGSSWSALGSGISGPVKIGYNYYALSVDALAVAGTNLYAGGWFTVAGGVSANYIARWNGSTWSAMGSGLNGSANALAVAGTNLYAGGTFTASGDGSQMLDYIAQWNGSAWSAVGSGMNNQYLGVGYEDTGVSALAVSGNTLYAGGFFPVAGGVAIDNIAQWNGSTWSSLGSDMGLAGSISALALSSNTLYVGGDFMWAGGISASNIAQWNGSSWSALGSGVDGTVSALAVSGTNLFVGGGFSAAGGVSVNNIAQWNGSSWSVLGSGLNYTVSALTVSGNTLYAGGGFTTSGDGNQTLNYIAQWNGSSWSALGSGLDGEVNALAVSGNTLYVGGAFMASGDESQTFNGIAQWNGSSWSALGPGFGDEVEALAVVGNTLYAGGHFMESGDSSQAFGFIAQWDGNNWSAPGFMNGFVDALAVSGTNLYAGGAFTMAGGVSANYIAQWNGSSWSALGSGLDGEVNALAVSGNALYAGGVFTTAGGKVSASVAEAILTLSAFPVFEGVPVHNANGSITLNLSTTTNTSSRLYSATNLSAPILWQTISTNFNGGLWQFTDTNTAAFKSKFYRLSTP